MPTCNDIFRNLSKECCSQCIITVRFADSPISSDGHTTLGVNDTKALQKTNKRKIGCSRPCSGGGKYKTMIYSFPQLVLRYFTCAHIIPPPYSRDSSFQRRSISKLDTGVGPAPQDEGKPILSGIWETVTTVPNEDTGYGYWKGVRGGGIKRAGDGTHPSNGKLHIQAKHVALFYSTLISFSLCGCLLCFRVLEVLLQLYINWKSSI